MQLVRLGANHAYKMLNDILGEIMEIRMYPHTAKREFIDQRLEEVEKKLSQAMQWVYGIKEL